MSKKLKMREDGAVMIRISTKSTSADEVIVVPGGPRRAYVWVGKGNAYLAHFGGEMALRQLRDALNLVLKKGRRHDR